MTQAKESNRLGLPRKTSKKQKRAPSFPLASDLYAPKNSTRVRSVLKTAVDSKASHSPSATQNVTESVSFAPLVKCNETFGEEYEKVVDPPAVQCLISTGAKRPKQQPCDTTIIRRASTKQSKSSVYLEKTTSSM